MNSYHGSGQLAKFITSRKRSKKFWTISSVLAILIILLAVTGFVFSVISENTINEEVHSFVKYENDSLITDRNVFKIHSKEKQEVSISNLLIVVSEGDEIKVTVSSISGELLSIRYSGRLVYKKEKIQILPASIALALFVTPFISFFIFLIVAVNVKKPGKIIDKLQKQLVLRFYK